MAAPGVAVPGSVVAIGSQTSPAGAQGVAGTNAITTTSAGFTVPAIGSTVSATVNDASWIVVGQMVYVDQAGGSGQAGILQVTAKAGNTLTLLNPQPAPAIPLASSAGAGLMAITSGNTTDFIDGTNSSQNLVTAIQPTIWSVRTRTFSSVGNPSFEIDQRQCGQAINPTTGGLFACDRWIWNQVGTGRIQAQRFSEAVPVPGTSFIITGSYLRMKVTTQETSLGASDFFALAQNVEGTQFRELFADVHSMSLLVRSSVAGLKFGMSVTDNPITKSLTKLCTVPSANTWTLITLPNMPVWPSGNFVYTPGQIGYSMNITLAVGSTYTTSANDIWVAGNLPGAVGQSNFMSNAINSTFDISFVQHESGNQCSTLMDVPFQQNYDSCLRYYQKTYDYLTIAGSTGTTKGAQFVTGPLVNTYATGMSTFEKAMEKVPTIVCYSDSTGAANNVRDPDAALDRAVSATVCNTKRLVQVNFSSAGTLNNRISFHYTADTGW